MKKKNVYIRPFQSKDEKGVIALWNDCNLVVPWNDPKSDIERKLNVCPELFLVGIIDDKIVATVMGGYEGHRGWMNYLAVSPEIQQKGVGAQIVTQIETELRKLGCPKINVQIRSSNTGVIEFYEKMGFSVDDVVSMGKRLVEDA